ncbi:MAG: UvrD-helicase domain-containing protein [Treponemataceae bacterium]|nr:UvrD-helicase domain-containing protein [Treponemataceae bacterium]
MNLDDLNEEQKEAVTSTEGFIRVIAGAGSGKTRALTNRFAYLVNEIGVLPSNILCVTFTNKAANEMRSRIRKLTGDNDTGYISTFHGFCVSILQEDSNAVNYPKSFLVLDNSDINAMLQIIYEERDLSLRQMTFGHARDMIEMKKLWEKPDYYKDMISMSLDELHKKYLEADKTDDIIFYGYLYQEKKCFGLDYNDLLKFSMFIFEQNPTIKQKWQERLEYIMIDEFQDIDLIQYQLMEILCGYHKNLFVVGDPDQTIYTWRGADIKYLMNFDKAFPDVKTIFMMKNYRSSPEIIKAANSLIDKNSHRIKKDLIPVRNSQNRPVYFHAKTPEDEACFIADEINLLEKQGINKSDIVVLYRAHYISRTIEEVFNSRKISYTLFSGLPFFERAEIKDSLSYLRMISYKDDLSFLRIVNMPKRNIGERRMNYLKAYVEKNGGSLWNALKICQDDEIFDNTKAKEFIALIEKYAECHSKMQISELFSHVMNESGYETALRTEGCQERLDNLAELKQSIYEYETSCGEESTLENYLSHVALYTNSDLGTKKDTIRFMTIHTAKGLEFPVVFIAGMNENMFPSKKVDSAAAMEEERRLAFVAYTRAENQLYLTEAEGTSLGFGFRFPSRFIFDVDKNLLEYKVELPENLVKDAVRYIEESDTALSKISSLSNLKQGARVEHSILGPGTIESIDEIKHVYTIKFDKISTPRKMSFKAPLKALEN